MIQPDTVLAYATLFATFIAVIYSWLTRACPAQTSLAFDDATTPTRLQLTTHLPSSTTDD